MVKGALTFKELVFLEQNEVACDRALVDCMTRRQQPFIADFQRCCVALTGRSVPGCQQTIGLCDLFNLNVGLILSTNSGLGRKLRGQVNE